MRKFILTFIISFSVLALPRRVEFVFLSEIGTTFLELNKFEAKFYSSIAKGDCIDMGDGCFHPQFGLMPKEAKVEEKKVKKNEGLKTFNALEVNLVNCDKNFYFDIFCGKSQKISKKNSEEIEIWFDVSTSMRKMDYSLESSKGGCERAKFAKKMQGLCPKNRPVISVYNERSKKEVGNIQDLCLSRGSNDSKRLIDWIKGSNAKYLLVVTDIDEMESLETFISEVAAKTYGHGVKNFSVRDFNKIESVFKKMCK